MSSQQNNYRVKTTSGEQIDIYSCVKLTASKVVKATAKADLAYGITQQSVDATDLSLSTQVAGISPARVDGNAAAIVIGDKLSPGPGGKLIKHDAVATTVYVAEALGASSADNDTIEVLIFDRKTV